jgi:hypothetical protein
MIRPLSCSIQPRHPDLKPPLTYIPKVNWSLSRPPYMRFVVLARQGGLKILGGGLADVQYVGVSQVPPPICRAAADLSDSLICAALPWLLT